MLQCVTVCNPATASGEWVSQLGSLIQCVAVVEYRFLLGRI